MRRRYKRGGYRPSPMQKLKRTKVLGMTLPVLLVLGIAAYMFTPFKGMVNGLIDKIKNKK